MKNIFFSSLFICLFACKSKQVSNIHLEATLARELISNKKLDNVNFCDKNLISTNWDSIVIIKPYCPVESLKNLEIGNFNNINFLIEQQTEGEIVMLLLNKGNCVAYSVIMRSIIDFSRLKGQGNNCFSLIRKPDCTKKVHYDYKNKWVYLGD